jgi:hypothetical protein
MSETASWRRSSSCSDNACVEVHDDGRTVVLRNSTKPASTIELTKAEWEALKKGIVAGEF